MNSLLAIAQQAILEMQKAIRWKPNKALTHLEKRISRGHLPVESTIEEYDELIQSVINNI